MSLVRKAKDIRHYGEGFASPSTLEIEKDKYLRAAARLYATADGIENRNVMMRFWLEGFHIHNQDPDAVSVARSLLRDEAAKHITEGRY